MQRQFALFTATLVLLVAGCSFRAQRFVEHPTDGDFIHLHSKGSWGYDEDILIKPDDSIAVAVYDSRRRRVTKRALGQVKGIFKSITVLINRRRAWTLTSQAIEAEVNRALTETGTAHGVMDANEDKLDVRIGSNRLTVRYYAALELVEVYPKATSLHHFAAIVQAVRKAAHL